MLDGNGGDFRGLQLHADASAIFGLTITGFSQHGLIIAAANCTIGGAAGVVIDGRPDSWIGYNAITRNAGAGVAVSGAMAKPATITGNKIWANSGKGIALANGANGGIAPPIILAANADGASGTACSWCEVQVYSDEADEG